MPGGETIPGVAIQEEGEDPAGEIQVKKGLNLIQPDQVPLGICKIQIEGNRNVLSDPAVNYRLDTEKPPIVKVNKCQRSFHSRHSKSSQGSRGKVLPATVLSNNRPGWILWGT